MSEKHEVLLRMKAVELLAYWEGRVVTNRLVEWFSISRQQASHDIKRYINDRNPESLVYSPAAKGYIPTSTFSTVLTQGHIKDYLELISGIEGETFSVIIESKEHLAAVQLPDRSVKPEVLREVLRACRASFNLEITYSSMNNPVPHKRVISPHMLIYTGFRWHVRAFCHKGGNYRDFILSRIQTPEVSEGEFISNDNDNLWQEQIAISLVANKNLSPSQQSLVENDFCMVNGKLDITVRKALAHYALQRYQAGITQIEIKDALKYPIVISERSVTALKPLLFNGASDE